jgi:hypothetical protein
VFGSAFDGSLTAAGNFDDAAGGGRAGGVAAATGVCRLESRSRMAVFSLMSCMASKLFWRPPCCSCDRLVAASPLPLKILKTSLQHFDSSDFARLPRRRDVWIVFRASDIAFLFLFLAKGLFTQSDMSYDICMSTYCVYLSEIHIFQ